MIHYLSVAEVNQRLPDLLQQIAQGEEIWITENGQPVARLAGLNPADLDQRRQEARARTRERMERGFALGGERLDRQSLHER